MSSNVIDGKLVAISPSMLKSFDANDSFGCEKRGYYKYVMGLTEPVSSNQQLGTDLHALIEQRLLTGKTPEAKGPAAGLYVSGQLMIEQIANRKIRGVEKALAGVTLDGVPVKGFIDVVTEDGIVDWKTTASIKKYGKTKNELADDMQMLIYAMAEHPELERVKLAHGQFQTSGTPFAQLVEVEIEKKRLDHFHDKVIIPLIQRVRQVVAFDDVKGAVADKRKCFRCPFRNNPCQPDDEDIFMSIFKTASKAPTPADKLLEALTESVAIVTPPRKESVFSVLPPDAPKSKPELAAKPPKGVPDDVMKKVNITAPIAMPPPPPKRRGRPPKPKMDETLVSMEAADMSAAKQSAVTIKSMTLSRGVTLNMGNFNSVRVELTLTADGSDTDALYSRLDAEIEARMKIEAAKYDVPKENK